MTESLDLFPPDAQTPKLVLKIAIPGPLRQCFDYLPPEGVDAADLRPGLRVEVPFGTRKPLVGYLLDVGASSLADPGKLKPALALLDQEPLISAEDCALLRWASRYYHYPLGEVFATAFPVLLRQGHSAAVQPQRLLCLTEAGRAARIRGNALKQKQVLDFLRDYGRDVPHKALDGLGWNWHPTARILIDKGWAFERDAGPDDQPVPRISPGPTLNLAQRQAVDAVAAALGGYQAFLLEGVTGSGKTEVYLRLVEQVLARGEQAMVLVPEINLTPQLQARFRARFSAPLAVFHSGLAEPERRDAWLAMQCGAVAILLGTRSAVFTPLARPGLIILDEEHDASFKQQEHFRFSARDVAVMRASQWRVPILMGSATPSLESLRNVQRGRYTRLSLPERTGTATHPRFHLIDLRNQRLDGGLSPALVAQVGATLGRGEQVLLFLNRRGFAPTLICHACGWVAECRHCDARMVMHSSERKLRCHHCGREQPLPKACPKCRTADLRPLGLGTERVEQALAKLFPAARVLRIDRDSTRRKGSLEKMLDTIHAGGADILLGTQMLAKGHHFPNVTLVGIIDLDSGLSSLDFRAGERTAQLIVQVAGRAGREERPGVVLLQTRQPEHPLLRKLIREGYPAFAEAALAERRDAELPPYTHQALWRADAEDAEAPRQLLARLAELAWEQGDEVLALGPVPAPLPRKSGRWRFQLLLQSSERKPLHERVAQLIDAAATLPEAKGVRWSVDVDPVDLY